MSAVDIGMGGGKVELAFDYSPRDVQRAKAIGGGRWNPERKVWTYALDLGVCKRIRQQFGDRLRISAELSTWAREEAASRAKLTELATAVDAELVNVPRYAPRIADAMNARTYQRVGAAFGARMMTGESGGFALLDQPGLGKTIQSLAAIIEANGAQRGVHLVLTPKTAVTVVWPAEVRQWLPERGIAVPLTGTREQREAAWDKAMLAVDLDDADVFVIANIEMVRIKKTKNADGKSQFLLADAEYPQLFEIEWDTVIVDESHRALIKSSQPTATRAGMMKLRSQRRIALSGTPMRGKPHQLWGTLNWLNPSVYTSYWNWVQRYFTVESNRYSAFVVSGDFRPGGEDQLAADLVQSALRRTKAEVAPDLPAKTYAGTFLVPGDPNSPHAVWLEMDPRQRQQTAKLARDGAIVLDGGELIANGFLAQRTREKQLAGACGKIADGRFLPALPSPKFDWLVGKLAEMGLTGKPEDDDGTSKIVVASQFTSLLNMFAKELTSMGIAVHLLTGDTTERNRRAMVEDFQKDATATRVFLLNTMAGGVAITLDAADDLVLLDETYIPDDQEQVEDRIHRVSRMHNVTIHYLKMLDTVEEEIAWLTAAREDVMRYILDGHRGVETAQKIYERKAA